MLNDVAASSVYVHALLLPSVGSRVPPHIAHMYTCTSLGIYGIDPSKTTAEHARLKAYV